MADSGSENESELRIDLKFKTIQQTYELRVKQSSNIEKVKKQLSKTINQPIEKICLIFSGKILKDHETLTEHKITNGMVIHMVIKNVPEKQQPQSRESTPSSTPLATIAPASSTQVGGAPMAGSLGDMGTMLNNPMVREMLNSPIMENLLNNPNFSEMLRSMLGENPQFQQIIQNNPELGHILNDQRIMQQTLEMIRNPNMFNELMRNHDQAIRNIQGIPGGEAVLHRLYQDVQEPLMNSVLGTPGTGNQLPTNTNNTNTQGESATSRSQHAGVENAEALPNPWSRVVNQQNGTRNVSDGAETTNGGLGGGSLPFMNMMNTPGMQSLMRQMLVNPNAMQSLMSPENMRNLGQMLGNPQLADQFRTGMANPQFLQAMANPRVFNALIQLQQAMQILHEEVPQLFPSLPGAGMLQNMGGLFGVNPPSAQQQQNHAAIVPGAGLVTDSNATVQQQIAGTDETQQAQHGNNVTFNNNIPSGFAELLSSIALMNMGNNMTGAATQQPPEERYRAQLEQLTAMGFTDQQANIQALLASFGDVNMAIERLLSSGGNVGDGTAGGAGQ